MENYVCELSEAKYGLRYHGSKNWRPGCWFRTREDAQSYKDLYKNRKTMAAMTIVNSEITPLTEMDIIKFKKSWTDPN